MDPELLTTLKALSDASRLRIVGLLATRPYAVAELADDLSLSPGTVVHHLKRLEAAGLVESTPRRPYVEYALRLDVLQEPLWRAREVPERDDRAAPRADRVNYIAIIFLITLLDRFSLLSNIHMHIYGS